MGAEWKHGTKQMFGDLGPTYSKWTRGKPRRRTEEIASCSLWRPDSKIHSPSTCYPESDGEPLESRTMRDRPR